MSQANVAIVQRIWDIYREGLERGDFGAVSDVYDQGLIAAESTYTPMLEVLGGRTYVGRDEFVHFVAAWTADWDEWAVELEELIDAGDDRVVGVARQSGIGKGSGAAVEIRFGMIYTLEDGQVVARRDCRVEEALEAAGPGSS